ncbi:hypothetical protein [Rummeliibacillus suwonensis]|uniref:hypothetical protein n=1 Tax=Rummeliibacillus suwonensis TaxID=1306154 RepID=UPI001AAE3F0B|nr:hypothetical protein [Rummeliibacillus suwonensis]MBO2535996.1 hypothetical protein [Rummeliibacillus suwonensis]
MSIQKVYLEVSADFDVMEYAVAKVVAVDWQTGQILDTLKAESYKGNPYHLAAETRWQLENTLKEQGYEII